MRLVLQQIQGGQQILIARDLTSNAAVFEEHQNSRALGSDLGLSKGAKARRSGWALLRFARSLGELRAFARVILIR